MSERKPERILCAFNSESDDSLEAFKQLLTTSTPKDEIHLLSGVEAATYHTVGPDNFTMTQYRTRKTMEADTVRAQEKIAEALEVCQKQNRQCTGGIYYHGGKHSPLF